jgi:hypothetical protein
LGVPRWHARWGWFRGGGRQIDIPILDFGHPARARSRERQISNLRFRSGWASGQAGQTDRTENRTHLTEIRTGLGLVLLSLSLHSVQLLIKIIIDTTKDQDLLQVDN